MRLKSAYSYIIMAFIFSVSAFGQQNASIVVGNIGPGEIQSEAFSLNKDANVQITGEAATFSDRHGSWFSDSYDNGWSNNLMFYCWILDSKTRSVVWHSLEKYPKIRTSKSTDFIRINNNIDLPKGNYEVYYASAKMNYSYNNNNDDFIDWVSDFFGFNTTQFKSKYKDKLEVKVSGPDGVFSSASIEKLRNDFLRPSIVSTEEAGNNKSFSKGFSLKGDTKLKIYAIGEAREKSTFDYAWVYDEVKNKIAWKMDWQNTEYAGGAKKNILFNNEIYLPAGTYTVHYVTDDSHSYNRWNSFPPDDPQFWGVAVFPATENDRANVIPFREQDAVRPVVELTRIGDDKLVSQGLRIKKPLKVRVLCLGESTGRNEYADYGWIINADTRETVWTMNGREGVNAGGAEKNKMIDETINLKPGNYIVYYATDGSHSYNDWNAASPYDPERWGITIWTDDNKSKSSTELFSGDNYKSKNVIAQIVRVRDNEHLKKRFELNKETKLRVYALGESSGHSLADFGFIKNDETGRIVWDMSYRRTEHAGGARKNRKINEVITLPKGSYALYYETDGSHSYRDWNDDPPTNQEDYGITVSFVK